MSNYKTIKNDMSNFKYPLGTIISKVGNNSYFDNVFGITQDKIGIIVGYDFEYNYYRVYYDKNSPFVGTREFEIELHNGDVPNELNKKKIQIEKEYDFKLLTFENEEIKENLFSNSIDIFDRIQNEIYIRESQNIKGYKNKWILYKRTSLLTDSKIFSSEDIRR